MNQTPFFATLGALASHQQENQLSRTFKACFDASESFRHLVIDFLRGRVHIPLPRSERWACDVEQAVKGKIGRLDFHIRAHDGDDGVAIESKVESPLREDQIAKYRKGGVKRLLIVTKHPPEVSERRSPSSTGGGASFACGKATSQTRRATIRPPRLRRRSGRGVRASKGLTNYGCSNPYSD